MVSDKPNWTWTWGFLVTFWGVYIFFLSPTLLWFQISTSRGLMPTLSWEIRKQSLLLQVLLSWALFHSTWFKKSTVPAVAFNFPVIQWMKQLILTICSTHRNWRATRSLPYSWWWRIHLLLPHDVCASWTSAPCIFCASRVDAHRLNARVSEDSQIDSFHRWMKN